MSTNTAKPLLISFKLCPFVQRAVIALEHKRIDYDIEYIDLRNKPEWFLKLSPLGKVPVLKVGDEILFESAVINEYLDEIYSPSLHPGDSLLKAKHRAWIEFGSTLFTDLFQMMTASDEAGFKQKHETLGSKLAQIEAQLKEEPYFDGPNFSLVDTSFAPFFMRLRLLEQAGAPILLQGNVRNWSEALLARNDVKRSVVDDFDSLFREMLGQHGGYLRTQLAL